jgi:hypothetical protein
MDTNYADGPFHPLDILARQRGEPRRPVRRMGDSSRVKSVIDAASSDSPADIKRAAMRFKQERESKARLLDAERKLILMEFARHRS